MKKKFLIFGLIFLFVIGCIGFVVIYLSNNDTEKNVSNEIILGEVDINENIVVITISINPEIELYVDINTGKVVNVTCKNDDAQKLIEDGNLNFLELSYEEAAERFITACANNGYLNENNNDINITVIQSDISDKMLEEYTSKIETVCENINEHTDFDIIVNIKEEYHNDNSSSNMVNVACPDCNGTGKCDQCDGEGHFTCTVCNGKAGSPCTDCGGDGLIPCPECDGYGGCKACNKTGVTACDKCGGAGCDWCNGSGTMECKTCHGNSICENCEDYSGSGYHHCNSCAGTGKTSCYRCNYSGYEVCQGCNGSGLCQACNGTRK